MESIISSIKTLIAGIISGMIAYFDPVVGKIESLLALFALNFAVGYLTGKIKNGEDFQMKKCLMCFMWGAVILVIICAFYFIGEHNGDKDGTLECLRNTILVAIWAFGTNILRNLCQLSKGNDPVYNFFWSLYYWLSFDFIRNIPWLASIAKERGQKTADELGEDFDEPKKQEYDES